MCVLISSKAAEKLDLVTCFTVHFSELRFDFWPAVMLTLGLAVLVQRSRLRNIAVPEIYRPQVSITPSGAPISFVQES